jgi:antitoxin YefM
MTIGASEARLRLFSLIEEVNNDHIVKRISSKAGDAVLMSAQDYDSWQETVYLLRSPANAAHLMAAVARDREGAPTVVKDLHELSAMAAEGDE